MAGQPGEALWCPRPAADQVPEQEEYVPVTLESMQDSGPAGVALALVIGYIALGVGVYTVATPWSFSEAVYFVAVTLSSVGYGDLTPESDAIKLFTAAYILLGVGILGTALGEVVSSLLNADATPAGRVIKWLSGAGGSDDAAASDNDGDDKTDAAELLFSGGGDAEGSLIKTLVAVALTIGVGSVAFLALEPSMSPVDALYSSVVTVTTVGYGDFTPTGAGARS